LSQNVPVENFDTSGQLTNNRQQLPSTPSLKASPRYC